MPREIIVGRRLYTKLVSWDKVVADCAPNTKQPVAEQPRTTNSIARQRSAQKIAKIAKKGLRRGQGRQVRSWIDGLAPDSRNLILNAKIG